MMKAMDPQLLSDQTLDDVLDKQSEEYEDDEDQFSEAGSPMSQEKTKITDQLKAELVQPPATSALLIN